MDADEFAKALSKRNINIRQIHLDGMENRFLKFAASTPENNGIVLNAIKEIFTNKRKGLSTVKKLI
jgi:histidinol-phosphate/aromatic aminotransferase/cobyric acid decarboxylase-like protein